MIENDFEFQGLSRMADKKDSSGGKPNDSTSPGASSGKKPKPLLDLKATEVRSGSAGGSGGAKPGASTSNLKGAPNWKEPGSSSAKPAGSSGSGTPATTSTAAKMASATPPPASASGSAAKSPTGADKASTATGASSGASTGTSSGQSSAGALSGTTAVPGSAQSSSTKTSGSKPSNTKSGAGGSDSPKPAPRRSGGGFFSTVSHLAAGVVGGGIALFAAEPVGQQFGLSLAQPPKMPAVLEQRLAALEARPASSGSTDNLRADVDQLSGKVEAAQKRLAELDKLGQQVASLTSDVTKARSAVTTGNSSNASTNTPSTNTDAPEPTALRARLAKLESALSTLSSATGAKGKPTGIAPLAQFSAKFADLEGSLNSQISALRKGLLTEMDARVATTADASSKAVAGAERLNREVSEIKTDTARLEQRSVVLKTASDKLAATTRAVSEQAAELKVELDTLKGSLDQELAKVARPLDLKNAIAPVAKKIASIEKSLGFVLASETARKQNAERIVLSLELSNLKRVLDRGAPYAAELADVKKVAGDAIDFSALETHKGDGVPSSQALTRQFSKVAFDIINAQDASKDDSRINRLFAAAKSIVQVRRTDVPTKENTAEAAVARIEQRLKDGDMTGALSLAEKLPAEAKVPAKDWMSKLAARAGVDRAIAKIENQLKASLGGGALDDKS